MCHTRLKLDFDIAKNNCFYIGGANGSGKSALFAALNIGLGGRGNSNERGNSVKDYIMEGKSRKHSEYGAKIAIERTISKSGSSYTAKSLEFRNGRCHEKVITTRRNDIDGILTRFDIQLSNPIFWMSQDRCRAFLQDMRPDSLYKVRFYI
ncbi:unnamed protein product [Enterobius vermicularis]|uniref:AAA_23 domain-containing protein n=1 Tax=Enterobius vermicularis TaxID=51028 RepID=A0A0N4VFU0_ENTVE|nr:unnamed protein product [Enterobius vermicularis]